MLTRVLCIKVLLHAIEHVFQGLIKSSHHRLENGEACFQKLKLEGNPLDVLVVIVQILYQLGELCIDLLR